MARATMKKNKAQAEAQGVSIEIDAAMGGMFDRIGAEARSNGKEDASGMRRYVAKCMASNDFAAAGRAMGCDAARAWAIYADLRIDSSTPAEWVAEANNLARR